MAYAVSPRRESPAEYRLVRCTRFGPHILFVRCSTLTVEALSTHATLVKLLLLSLFRLVSNRPFPMFIIIPFVYTASTQLTQKVMTVARLPWIW
jgi:hypothetical protein